MGLKFVWQREEDHNLTNQLEEANELNKNISEAKRKLKSVFRIAIIARNENHLFGTRFDYKHAQLLSPYLMEGLEALELQVRKDIKEIAKEIYEQED